MKSDPASTNAVVGKALKLDGETVSGMLSGLKLTPYADNAQFYGLSGGKPSHGLCKVSLELIDAVGQIELGGL